MRTTVICFCICLAACAAAGESAPINAKTLQPGLAATYRSDDGTTLFRIDPKPALALGTSSPHPRLAPGPFSVEWTGVIQLRGEGPFTFDAYVSGEATVTIDNKVVLQGLGETESAQLRAQQTFDRSGRLRIKIAYRALPNVPARFQLWWSGADFSREPVPAWLFKHAPEELRPVAAQENLAATGRVAVGRYGCAVCHADAFPAVTDPPPGPSLAGVGTRVTREWLFTFLNDPAKAHASARMPILFKSDRDGAVERWLIADYLTKGAKIETAPAPAGDHRRGNRDYLLIGCVACHFIPDAKRDEQKDLERTGFEGLADRLPAADLIAFLQNPASRYPDGRHPQQPVTPDSARDIAAYLLLWPGPALKSAAPEPEVTAAEIEQAAKRFGVDGADAAAKLLLRNKGCSSCHAGLDEPRAPQIPLPAGRTGGCLSENGTPRYKLDAATREAIAAYSLVAFIERHDSPVEERSQLIRRLGCFRCHSNTERTPALEEASASLGGSKLEAVPYLRTPRLNNASLKYSHEYLSSAIRDGVSGVRHNRYSFRMPKWGAQTEAIVQALAEMDGDLVGASAAVKPAADPTLTGPGASLVGFEGYSCVSCHIWNGKQLNDGDPGAIGPDLTGVTQRVRRDWFERWMDEPGRIHPGTVMPQIFTKGQPAQIKTVFDGDSARQKEAIWAFLSLGKEAPTPKPMPPAPVDLPAAGAPPLVAQIPIKGLDGKNVESICIVYGSHDLLLYDVGGLKLTGAYTGAQILRAVRGRVRTFALAGNAVPNFAPIAAEVLDPKPQSLELLGYERLADGARIRRRARFADHTLDCSETIRLVGRKVLHEIHWTGTAPKTATYELPAAAAPAAAKYPLLPDPGPVDGALERPGYRAIAYPRPRTITGEDLIMPGAIAAHPADGRVFVASMKNGELFVLRDPTDDGKNARWENYGGGLFQEAYSMLAEKDGLYVLHRRNLTRITETDGVASRFERVFALPHGIAETYDYGYGLARDKTGAFVMSYAPYANRKLPGSGSMLRMVPGEKPDEVAFGFRNPVGWCADADGEVFYTDNQGEWVATNKLCHIVRGRYYGFPNPEQREHTEKPFGKTTLWVPYAWARSINGVTYNHTGEKFGPFAGQFFMAELMYGGAIIRASLEKVNGEYQGACFPFWGKGLLGPVTLAFDSKGRLYVGSITEPGWMAQPDRGAVFRVDFTGAIPFEMHSINVRPHGFRVNFTQPIDAKTATTAALTIEHYRYEYSGAYGSPELDRTALPIEKVEVGADGRSIELHTAALVKERVYMINAGGVKSAQGGGLVHPIGAYTLNEIPAAK